MEEVYEVFEAIEREDWTNLQDELGDLFLQVLFYAQIASDEGKFSMEDVAATLSEKLLRRHPHVFSTDVADSPAAVMQTWEKTKRQEHRNDGKWGAGVLENVPRAMPALLEAARLGSRAAKVGFDWDELQGILEKVQEEIRELEREVVRADQHRVEEELGDVLFSMVNLARHLAVDAEQALRRASGKFRDRFKVMEEIGGDKLVAGELSAAEWESAWAEAKERVNKTA